MSSWSPWSHLSEDGQRPTETTMFRSKNVTIGQAIMSVHNVNERSRSLELLRQKCSLAALVDSNQRYDAPSCAENTRLYIIQHLENWVRGGDDGNSPNSSSTLFWLHGGAGVGKSALAQTLAEKLRTNGELAASFFFFRTDSRRNDGDSLIPTLAYQLTRTFQGLAPIVEAKIREDPDLFEKDRRTQMLKLVVEPLIRLSVEETNSELPDLGLKNHPRLIVIDGLDECFDTGIQSDLLLIIADTFIHLPYSLRFLIASRPESHIARVFDHDLDSPRYNLSYDLDAAEDIKAFLKREFREIRRTHPAGPHLPSPWPVESAISSLVEQASSHFIYASTVIRFIQPRHHNPHERLQIILGLQQRHKKDRPYRDLDLLYKLIFFGVEDRIEEIHCAFGIIHLRSLKNGLFGWNDWTCDRLVIEELIGLGPGDLVSLFDPLLSLVAIDEDDIHLYHKSLFDYLLDSDRSGDNVLDLSLAHEAAMKYLLGQKDMLGILSDRLLFFYHCQFARLNEDTTRYLQSLASDSTILDLAPQEFLYFLQVLSRPDFDSSGDLYKKFIQRQTKNLSSRVPWTRKLKSIPHKIFFMSFAEEARSAFRPFQNFNLSVSLCDRVNGCYRRTAVPPIEKVCCGRDSHPRVALERIRFARGDILSAITKTFRVPSLSTGQHSRTRL